MVRHISDRIGVMYLGKMVEVTTSEKLNAKPLHPYTQSLLSAIPIPDPEFRGNGNGSFCKVRFRARLTRQVAVHFEHAALMR